MYKYYSQHGEDFVLSEIFNNKGNGFFIEIGCIDGRRFSNTLTFEERGWTGLCVEAHNDYIELLKKNRPHSTISHCAVGDRNEDNVVFYANSRGSASTLDKSHEAEFRRKFGKYFTGFEEQIVKMKTLNTVLTESNVTDIDILSLDIEGSEVRALKGFDWDRWCPGVMVIEADDLNSEKELDDLLLKRGYIKGIKMIQNIFYIREPVKIDHLPGKTFVFELINTQHPLDESGDVVTEVFLTFSPGPGQRPTDETTPPRLTANLKNKLKSS